MFEFTVIYKSDWGMTQTKIIIARTLNSCIKLFEKKYPTAYKKFITPMAENVVGQVRSY